MAETALGSSATWRWTRVWARAVIAPAWRRAVPVWLGTGIVGGLFFGKNGISPREFADLALGSPAVFAVVAAIWILLFLPSARVIVRADGARYLRSLPALAWPPLALSIGALIGLQLPWLALWLTGAGALGALVIALVTLLVVALALVRARPPRTGALAWRGPLAALFGVYARALRRRAADALVRALGMAVLAGIAAGLFVRNNELDGRAASALATAVIAVVLAPGWAGAMLPLAEAHRDSAWLAASTGVTERQRLAALACAAVAVYALFTAIAAAATAWLVPDAAAWLFGTSLATACGLGLAVARGLARAAATPEIAMRAVTSVIVATALAVLALGLLDAAGALAVLALGALAIGRAP